MRKAVFLPVMAIVLLFIALVPTAHADLSVTGASCDVTLDARYGDAKAKDVTVDIKLKNTGNASATVYEPSLPSPGNGITLTKSSSDSYPLSIGSGSTKTVKIKVHVPGGVDEGTYTATADFAHGSATITIKVDRWIPAHLAPLANINIKDPVVFNKPRKEMESTGFKAESKFQIANDGDLAMTIKSVAPYGTPDAGMTFNVNYPSKISNQSADTATLTITIPVSAPEGEHQGKLRIDCGKAGLQTITVSVTVEHAVKFEMSAYPSNFGRVDVLKSTPLTISLEETLGYKDISAVKIKRDETPLGDGKDDWMSVDLPASVISKGGSVPLTFTLRFRGETIVGRTYRWDYYLSHSAGNATITLRATATPIDIEETKNMLQTLEGSDNSEISSIAGKASGMLSSGSAGSADEWAAIASISQASVTFLEAMDRALGRIDEDCHGDALNDLLIARISVDTMQKSAKTKSQTAICTASNNFVGGALQKESAHFEAMASGANDDRTRIVAHRCAATTYGLLNEPEKSEKSRETAEEYISAYNQKIESANDRYVDSEDAIRRASDDLYRWGDVKLLVNPFVYDSTSYRYKFAINETDTAAEEYKMAGESDLCNTTASRADELHIQWLFLLSQFLMLMVGYILLFAGAVIWCVLAFMAFTADSREEEFGDVVLLS